MGVLKDGWYVLVREEIGQSSILELKDGKWYNVFGAIWRDNGKWKVYMKFPLPPIEVNRTRCRFDMLCEKM